MIIMFIFLGLTIVFIIGTAIYLNKSKKQNGFTQNIDKKENQGKKVDKKKLEKNILLLEEKNKKTNTSKGTKKEQKK